MEPSRGRAPIDEILEDALEALPSAVLTKGRADNGGPLLLVLACRLKGHALTGGLLEALVSRLKLTEAHIRSIGDWTDRLIEAARSGGEITLCRGLTCSMHAAGELHGHLLSMLSHAGLKPVSAQVHCLSQCGDGPSVMVGKAVWVTRACKVVEDQRDWREPESGPVPISDTSRPVRD